MTTTIKVSTATRDRLKAQAAQDHLSLGAHLDRLADLADRRARLAALRKAVDATSPQALTAYRAEASAWADADLVDRP